MTSAATHFALHDGQLLRHEMKTKAVAKLAVASEMVGVGGNGQTRKKTDRWLKKRNENKKLETGGDEKKWIDVRRV